MTSAERDAQIAEDYKSLSASKVAAKWGLSLPHVNRIVKAAGVVKGHSVSMNAEDKIIDDTHRILGQRLYYHRNTVKCQHTVLAAQNIGGWSVKKLRNIEQGLTVLTLPDLKAIAAYMGLPLTKLLENI